MIELLIFLLGLAIGFIIGNHLRIKKFSAKIVKDEIVIEEVKPGKCEFLSDATQQELEDLERPEWKKFLDKFVK